MELKHYSLRIFKELAVLASLLLVACGGTAATPAAPTLEPKTEQAGNTAALKLAKEFQDFQVQFYQGEEVFGATEGQFSQLFGKRQPVVLNFFAGLCPPCRAEMPDFQRVSVQYQDKVTFFGLDIGPFVQLGSQEEGQALIQELGITYPTGTTFDGSVIRAYQILGMPTTVFLTPDGKVFEKTNFLARAKLVELVEELLKASR